MLIGIYGKVCVPSAPVCLVSVLVEETHFISKTTHRGQSGSLLFTMSYYAFKKISKNTNYKLFC